MSLLASEEQIVQVVVLELLSCMPGSFTSMSGGASLHITYALSLEHFEVFSTTTNGDSKN
jgi:hypothetical protein